MDGKSTDITAEKIAQLRQLFPEVFSEDTIDFQRLKQALGEDLFAKGEHYELSWAGKSEARKAVQMQTTATLIPDRKSSIDFDNAPNIFIEGENLEVLRVLQKSLFGKVKMIYIDPPYNTGNDSFVYPDDYTERQEEYNKRTGITDENGYLNKQDLWKKNTKENGQFHSVWLSMMFPRLYLCRNLLQEEGMIFISIDDNEAVNLKLLCDEIFGEENFICQFIWQKGAGTENDNNYVATSHEYILFYSKNKLKCNLFKLPPTKAMLKSYDLQDEYVNERGKHYLRNLNDFSIGDRPGLHYDIICPDGTTLFGKSHRWRCDKDRFDWRIKQNRIVFSKNSEGKWEVFYKQYLFETKEQVIKDTYGNILTYGKIPDSLLLKIATTGNGTKDLKNLFTDEYFSYPKPKDLIKHLLQISSKNNELILDFFSGSGTTAQAVMELNEEDGGNRRFICVQMPEPTDENSEAFKAGYTTISEITKARITKVIEKLTKARAEKAEKQAGEMFTEDTTAQQPLSFAAYSLTESNFKIWRSDVQGKEAIANQLNAFQQSEIEGTEHERMFTELCLKSGLGLNIGYKEENGFFKTQKALWFCFVPYQSTMKDEIVQSKPERVIFLNSCFQSDMELTNVQLELKEHGIDLVII
jgi:adenine-specific DNA-methyltransferase